jgi:hypothetical protein
VIGVGDSLVVHVVPLALVDCKLALGPARIERATGWRDGRGSLGEVRPDDLVSIHWGWACDVLASDQLDRLIGWMEHQLSVANETL